MLEHFADGFKFFVGAFLILSVIGAITAAVDWLFGNKEPMVRRQYWVRNHSDTRSWSIMITSNSIPDSAQDALELFEARHGEPGVMVYVLEFNDHGDVVCEISYEG